MKRFLNTITILLSIFFITLGDATAEMIGGMATIDPKIVINGKTIESYQIKFRTYCYNILTGEKLPCPFKVNISKAFDQSCIGGPDIKCGHNDAKHEPSSRLAILINNNAETTRILGGVADTQNPVPSNELPIRISNPYYDFKYLSGEITGLISIRKYSAYPPSGYKFVSPPCDSNYTCTTITPVSVEHCGSKDYCQRFVELPEPMPPTEENLLGWWDGYVRCGKSSDCDVPDNIDPNSWLQYDKPYNWPAHPTTNWGQWQFLWELTLLANRWYSAFGKPLVINDISLPRGGLLDVDSNWKTPHSSHRKGIDADILRISVPANMRPSGSSDTRWLDLYREFDLFKYSSLRCLEKKRDYNHLQHINYFNIIVLP
jgi:hypothetical protein